MDRTTFLGLSRWSRFHLPPTACRIHELHPISLKGRVCRAFTLVEVVIAVGVFAFAAISLLGLITLAMQSSHDAGVQSTQATMVSTITGQLSSQNFTNTVASLPFTDYFTEQGVETNAAAAIYRCAVADVSPTSSTTNFMRQVQLQICWPVPVYARTNVVVASLVKYD